jgi:hypothetical protein
MSKTKLEYGLLAFVTLIAIVWGATAYHVRKPQFVDQSNLPSIKFRAVVTALQTYFIDEGQYPVRITNLHTQYLAKNRDMTEFLDRYTMYLYDSGDFVFLLFKQPPSNTNVDISVGSLKNLENRNERVNYLSTFSASISRAASSLLIVEDDDRIIATF